METDGDMAAVSKGKKPGKKRRNRAGASAAEFAPRLKKISQEIWTRVQIGAYEPHQRVPAAA
jgi:hypothetical protein